MGQIDSRFFTIEVCIKEYSHFSNLSSKTRYHINFGYEWKIYLVYFSYETQVALVRNAWSDIFILGMAQCAQTMNLQNILSSIVSHLQTSVSQDKLSATRVRQVTTTICKIQEYVRAINKLNVDDWEFAYLKAISLFGAGKKLQYFLI